MGDCSGSTCTDICFTDKHRQQSQALVCLDIAIYVASETMQLLGMLPQMPGGNAGLWGLDDLEDPETAAVVQQAIDDPDRFVLKPQREGGGNNLYGEAARQKLQTKKGLSAYILMQRIRPPINRCWPGQFARHCSALLQADGIAAHKCLLLISCITVLGEWGRYACSTQATLSSKAAVVRCFAEHLAARHVQAFLKTSL